MGVTRLYFSVAIREVRGAETHIYLRNDSQHGGSASSSLGTIVIMTMNSEPYGGVAIKMP